MKNTRTCLAPFALVIATAATAHGQCEPRWSDAFGPFEIEGPVLASTVFDDGSGPALFVAGEFTQVDDHVATRIVRWSAGDGWTALGSGIVGPVSSGSMDAHVYALQAFDDGGGPALYVAGEFTIAGGVPCVSIARWKDGVWSDVGGGLSGGFFDTRAHALCVHDDGSGPALYVGGNFTGAGGVPASKIARWNGVAWSAVGGGIDGVQGNSVYALASYNGELYAGGEFPGAEGVSAPSLARWNGTSWSLAGGGANGVVNALCVFDDGSGSQLYAGGSFTLLGVPAPRIARWDGAAWSAPATGPTATVSALGVFDAGSGADLYVTGQFSGAGSASGRVVRWNGGAWAGLGVVPGMFQPRTLAVLDDADGKRLVVGAVSSGGTGGGGLHAWNGTQWSQITRRAGGFGSASEFTGRFVAAVHGIDHGAGLGKWVYAGGRLLNGVTGLPGTRHLARFDGHDWDSLGDVTAGGSVTDVGVYALDGFDDGTGEKLVVAGRFDAIGGFGARSIATFDGETWSTLGGGLSIFGQPASVGEVVQHDDGAGPALYVIGAIDSASGVPVNDIARWDGANWSDVAITSASCTLYDMISFDDGGGPKLYVSGFIPLGGPSEALVVRWDGTSWTDVSAGMVIANTPPTLGTFDDGTGAKLFAASDSAVVHVWDGTQWQPAFAKPTGFVGELIQHDDGSGPALYVGGGFASPSAEHLARWNGTTLSSADIGRPSGSVYALASFDFGTGSDLFAGGDFNQVFAPYGSLVSHAFARLASTCPPPGETFCSGDGTATACPCGNSGASGHGCATSFDANGALLVASGIPRVSADSLQLDVSGVSNSIVTFIQGTLAQNGGLGTVFGDGLRCAGGSVIRLGTALASSNAASYPSPSQQAISVRGQIPLLGGTRTYQVWYRNSVSFCTPSTFNLSNGVRTTWAE